MQTEEGAMDNQTNHDNQTNQPTVSAAGAPGKRRRYLPVLPPALITVLVVTTAVVAAVGDPKIPEAVGD
jgi:hypothetical protein